MRGELSKFMADAGKGAPSTVTGHAGTPYFQTLIYVLTRKIFLHLIVIFVMGVRNFITYLILCEYE